MLILQANSCLPPMGPKTAVHLIAQCLEANPGFDVEDCNFQGCFTSPYQLKAMDQILVDVAATLNNNNVPYWLEGGTLLGAMRFNAHMPFDDDVDIQLMETDFNKNYDSIAKQLLGAGYDFYEAGRGLWRAEFSESKKTEFIKELTGLPDSNGEVFERISATWPKEISWPVFDFFLMRDTGDSVAYISKGWPKWCKVGSWPKDLIFPLVEVDMLGNMFTMPKNALGFANLYFGIKDAYRDFVAGPNHNPECSTKIRFKNICDYPDWVAYFKSEIIKAYGQSFQVFPEPLNSCLPKDNSGGLL